MKRRIITIDEDRCTGCGLCVPNCPEGALQIIDGKARLVGDLFCDGLGACIGRCPEGAITTEIRDAEPYDEEKVMENIVRGGPNVIRAHLAHLRDHGQGDYFREALAYLVERDIEIPAEFLEPACRCGDAERAAASASRTTAGHEDPAPCGCPGSRVMSIESDSACASAAPRASARATPPPVAATERPSRLRQWPVQIMLVPPTAPFLDGADILVAADCVPCAYAGFHEKLLNGKVLLVGCPKLDDAEHYLEKLTEMFKRNDVRSVAVAHMEVPCCTGLVRLVERAIRDSGKDIPLQTRMIGIRGNEM